MSGYSGTSTVAAKHQGCVLVTQTGPVLGAATATQHLSQRGVPEHDPGGRGVLRKEDY